MEKRDGEQSQAGLGDGMQFYVTLMTPPAQLSTLRA